MIEPSLSDNHTTEEPAGEDDEYEITHGCIPGVQYGQKQLDAMREVVEQYDAQQLENRTRTAAAAEAQQYAQFSDISQLDGTSSPPLLLSGDFDDLQSSQS